jgi:hypothetical protein
MLHTAYVLCHVSATIKRYSLGWFVSFSMMVALLMTDRKAA